MLNGHDLKVGDSVLLIAPGWTDERSVTSVTDKYIYLGVYKFYKTTGRGPKGTKAQYYRIERIKAN